MIRRRRVCIACNFRFTTFERVQLRELTVIKRNGRRVPFDRDKLVRSLQISLRKRPVDPERVEKMVSAIVRELESGGECEVSSEAIGEIVMEHLRQLDDVAYVRFASVYRNFREAKDFEAVLGELSGDDDAAARDDTQMIFRILEDQYAAEIRDVEGRRPALHALALALGRRGQGRTWPNPAVGAVVVKDGVIVGRGWTQAGGRPHAEAEALGRAGEAARGATLYVTLEPCSHFGKSPPCADAVIAAGIARVVSAIEDPNPEVAGRAMRGCARPVSRSMSALRRGSGARPCRTFPPHPRHRPHVILKLAVSADDKIGAAGRKPVAITGEAARTRVHLLRAQCDAILVGIGTVLADDPLLTCRLPGMEARSPVRVVLDRALRIPGASRLVHSARETPLWVMASNLPKRPPHEARGGRRAGDPRGQPSAAARARSGGGAACAFRKRHHPAAGRGRGECASSFVAAGLVDEIWLLRGPGPVGADGVAALDALPLRPSRSRRRSVFVLAKACRTIPDDLRARIKCSPALSPISARSPRLTPTAQGQLHRLRIACRYDRDHCRRRVDRLQRRLPDGGRLGGGAAGPGSRSMPPPRRWP